MAKRRFVPGEPVIFCKVKHGDNPGPRAHDISPARSGDSYAYVVDKFWVVVAILANGQLLLRTRRGKEHIVDANNPNLRRATWWERIRYRDRFPEVEQARTSA
jgi:hypothetical protein